MKEANIVAWFALLVLFGCGSSDTCEQSALSELKEIQKVIAEVEEQDIPSNLKRTGTPVTYLKNYLMKEDQPMQYGQRQIVSASDKKLISEAVKEGYFDQIEIFNNIVLYRVSTGYGYLNDNYHYIMHAKEEAYRKAVPKDYGIVNVTEIAPEWYCVERRTSLAAE